MKRRAGGDHDGDNSIAEGRDVGRDASGGIA